MMKLLATTALTLLFALSANALDVGLKYPPKSASSGGGSSAAPGGAGADTQVIYNSGGLLASNPGLTYNATSGTLFVSNSLAIENRATMRIQGSAGIRLGFTSPTNVAQFAVANDLTGFTSFSTWPQSGAACVGLNCSAIVTPATSLFAISTTDVRVLNTNGMSIGFALTRVPTTQLEVSGTISATGVVKVGSPTTAPTCNAAALGAIYVNATTNCLVYCNGTTNVQITSVAGSCT